jgi:hypothetical protein
MAHHPTFTGHVSFETPFVRKCLCCRRLIGKRGESFDYSANPTYHVCPRCHRKVSKPGYEHRVPKVPGNLRRKFKQIHGEQKDHNPMSGVW